MMAMSGLGRPLKGATRGDYIKNPTIKFNHLIFLRKKAEICGKIVNKKPDF